MAYIVQRNHRFYVVAYDGIDPITGRQRRRWHPAGRSRADAEAIVARLATDRDALANARPRDSQSVRSWSRRGCRAVVASSDRRPRSATSG